MNKDNPIIFFDGVCNLCNGFIDQVLRSDKKHIFFVASLQGQTAKKLLSQKDFKTLNTVILKVGPKIYYKSSAIFKIAMDLQGLYWLIMPFWILPRFFTNWIYDLVAFSRYRLFGKKNTCRIPTELEKKHFLD